MLWINYFPLKKSHLEMDLKLFFDRLRAFLDLPLFKTSRQPIFNDQKIEVRTQMNIKDICRVTCIMRRVRAYLCLTLRWSSACPWVPFFLIASSFFTCRTKVIWTICSLRIICWYYPFIVYLIVNSLLL